jgi:hypothetical protein
MNNQDIDTTLIANADASSDEYVRHTRPKIARQSWYFGSAFVFAFELAGVFKYGEGAPAEIALILLSPALAYSGFRTIDKFAKARK